MPWVKRRKTSGAIRFALWAPRRPPASLRECWSDSEPAGVLESAASRGASVPGVLLLTEATVTEVPEPKQEPAPMAAADM
jgi:hypothetical protein